MTLLKALKHLRLAIVGVAGGAMAAPLSPDLTVFRRSSNVHVRNFGATIRDSRWTKLSIDVCWEPSDQTQYRESVRDAVKTTWEATVSTLHFEGWQECLPKSEGIRIRVLDEGPRVRALGRYLANYPDGMVLNFSFDNWGIFCQDKKDWCIRVIAVHEFGHALGLVHENNRDDRAMGCQAETEGFFADWKLSKYDPKSVMNMCNKDWNGSGQLSALDVESIKKLYG